MTYRSVAAAMAAGCLGIAPAALGEEGESVVLDDPEGDCSWEGTPWLDIVGAELRDDGDDWTFIIVMAGDVIGDWIASTNSSRIKSTSWHWGLETDPDSAPDGYPVPNGGWLLYEYMINVFEREDGLHADWIDRRPLVDSHDAIVTPVDFTVSGPVITVSIPKDWIEEGDFLWRFGTTAHRGEHYGNYGYDACDVIGFPFTPTP